MMTTSARKSLLATELPSSCTVVWALGDGQNKVYLEDLDPNAVRVEGAAGGFIYYTAVPLRAQGHASYRTVPALRCPSKSILFFGSSESTSSGKRTTEDSR